MKKQRWRFTKGPTRNWQWECEGCGKRDCTSTLRLPKGWHFGGYGIVFVSCNSCGPLE
ncbi:putative lipoprotein [Bacillus phage Stills]|uniref:Putative lipoprotein n=1 Tax=Bacillus phage Stills TaxID=1610833 RepID=A0A0E3T5I8_9CAUD|nr:lipoprotein [Bacillus phage Stills]AKC02641.1 putative lipoprotein [Bacillus phage Stills]